jgi:VIT1/CCC1 family predicted Fe2+/Mn2+ transporter
MTALTIILIAFFTASFALGYMVGKASGLNEAKKILEDLEKQTRKY